MGSEQKFVLRIPPTWGLYLSAGSCCSLLIALLVAASVGVPYGLNGPGLACTALASALSVCSVGLSKIGCDMAEAKQHSVAPVADSGPVKVREVPRQLAAP